MKTIYGTLLAAFLCLVSSCGSPTNSDHAGPSLVGKWQWQETDNDGLIFRFHSDGTYTIHEPGTPEVPIEEGTYSYSGTTITYNIEKTLVGDDYRAVETGETSRYISENCYLSDDIFSQRAMVVDGNQTAYQTTWSSMGGEKWFTKSETGAYLSKFMEQSERVFTEDSYTRKYTVYHEYDETGTETVSSRADFVYTDVAYADDENWTGNDSGTTVEVRSKIFPGDQKSSLLFEFLRRVAGD